MRLKYLFACLAVLMLELRALSQSIPSVASHQATTGSISSKNNFDVRVHDAQLQFAKKYLKEKLSFFQPKLGKSKQKPTIIELKIKPAKEIRMDEGYVLDIRPKKIIIQGKHPSGVFRGVTTLIQLYALASSNSKDLKCQRIVDQPKFDWRGMHLDVSRHFFPVSFIKKYIDLLALYKMNVFHWHLTDDQGWRIEIKKYPKLTEVGAWRNGTMVGPYSDQKFDTLRYGGYYTQEEIKDVVRYAAERHITIVPEIEMPGHALAALASYPEYSCQGGPFEVAKGWGVFDDVFCTKEETFHFIEDILSEVVALFPSKVIHIGGDECPKVRWKSCAHCQKRMAENGLKDEHELQSYFIRRVEKFLQSKGRKLIGWDEILEGGLAPEAMVMSWRGTEGGIAAAQMKHFAVMSPGSHCYFDHYQGNPKHEPLAFGGYTPLEKVYSFDPIPQELNLEEAKYILGAQANVWTEYISGTVPQPSANLHANIWKMTMSPEQHVEYMVLPRLLALSEVLWGTANPEHYNEFLNRVVQHKKQLLTPLNYHFSQSIYEIGLRVFPKEGELFAELSSPLVRQLYYAMDLKQDALTMTGKEKLIYREPIKITHSGLFRYSHDFDAMYNANTAVPENMRSLDYSQVFSVNKATAKPIHLVNEPHKSYSFGGSFSLVNGIHATKEHLGKDWLGFFGEDLIATIDLGQPTTVQKFGMNVLNREGSWVYLPQLIRFEISTDGANFQEVATLTAQEILACDGEVGVTLKNSVQAKFVRATAINYGMIPDGNPGAGNRAWLFVDEVMVE